jgi:hypothetical protein
MKSIKLFVLPILLVSALFACKNAEKKPENTNVAPSKDTVKVATEAQSAKDTIKETTLMLTAMFVDFTLGDAEHYSFKDKAGKTWDFGGCDDKSIEFAEELPEAKTNETNQGWTSNKSLQKKWFDLKYVIRNQPQYEGGPMTKVPIIVEAKPAAQK